MRIAIAAAMANNFAGNGFDKVEAVFS